MKLTLQVVKASAIPASATKCVPGVVCQYVVGAKLNVTSWTAVAWQYPIDGEVCDPAAYFYYNWNNGDDLWDYEYWDGCETVPDGYVATWSTQNVGPVSFSRANQIAVVFDPIWGSTPPVNVQS